jgi:MYXO-CTERM domain-containing protein
LYEASLVEIRSNAISLAKSDAVCFEVAASSMAGSDYNVCNRPWSNNANWAKNLEAHSISAEPGFKAANNPSWDLRPASLSSALVDHGAPVGNLGSAAVDFFDNARTGVPDVGPYEFGNPGTSDDAGVSGGTDAGPVLPSDAGGGEGVRPSDGGPLNGSSDASDGGGGCGCKLASGDALPVLAPFSAFGLAVAAFARRRRRRS